MLVSATLKSTKIVNNSVTPVEEGFSTDSFQTGVMEFKRFWIERALEQTNGNQVKAAELLGVNRNTLKKFIDKLGIDIQKSKREH